MYIKAVHILLKLCAAALPQATLALQQSSWHAVLFKVSLCCIGVQAARFLQLLLDHINTFVADFVLSLRR